MPEIPEWAKMIAVFDTETTGVDPRHARIVTATVAVLDEHGAVQERHDWIIDPQVEIPEAAASVHGITTDVARETGMFPEVGIQQLSARVQSMFDRGFAVAAFNAPYDFTILFEECRRYALPEIKSPRPIIDPLILDRQLDRYRRGKRTLSAMLEHYGLEIEKAHDAGEDAIATGRLVQRLTARYASTLPDDVEELHDAQIEWARLQAERFQEWMRSNRDPSFVADGEWPVRGPS